MTRLVLISPEGLILENEKRTPVFEESKETPLHVIATRAAESASTTAKKVNEQ